MCQIVIFPIGEIYPGLNIYSQTVKKLHKETYMFRINISKEYRCFKKSNFENNAEFTDKDKVLFEIAKTQWCFEV